MTGSASDVRPRRRKVFLDANIVISAGKPPGGPELARVIDLVEAGIIRILTTDLTICEVAKKHIQNDFDQIKLISQPSFRKVAARVTGVDLPEINQAELRQKLTEMYTHETAKMFESMKAKTLVIDDIKPSIVFHDYTHKKGFFSGEGKKAQFPDAFAFECLKKEASQKEPVIIVSRDGDFEGPAAATQYISLVRSLPELFDILGLRMEAPEVDKFLAEKNGELVERINQEVSDWGMQIDDVNDAEITRTIVNSVKVLKLTSFKATADGDPILVTGKFEAQVTISFTYPDWDTAVYDSEERVSISRRNIISETDIDFPLDFSLEISVNAAGTPKAIERISIRAYHHISALSY
jgi:hypothetical protein